ncbi:MAG: hypothetical protein KDE27_16910, partial [Planctomycetes bacterium]|nr:hypothetical protein [Planctomycetota bacterium]
MSGERDLSVLEERIAEIAALPDGEQAAAFAALRREHPAHEQLLLRCETELRRIPVGGGQDPAAAVGEQIGPHRVLGVLGEGGMGTV